MLNIFQTSSTYFSRIIKRRHNCLSIFGKADNVFCLGLFTLLLPGCAVKRNAYDVPQMALPAQYKNAAPVGAVDETSASKDSNLFPAKPNVAKEAGLTEWWRSFGNSELVELIDRGLANNSDVRIATTRIAQAKARADQARAGLMPVISAPIGVTGSTTGSTTGGTASVRGGWRVDLWGEQSSLTESAKFQLWQSAFERDNVQRNMAASLASNYVEFLALNDRLRIARKTETVLNDMLATIKIRVNAGDAAPSDFDQQKASIFAIRATTPVLEQQREDALTTIAFLMGTVPGSVQLSGGGLDTLYLPAVMPALPSSLLLRRPDVRMVEAQLLAADANVDVARARILPPLDFSAQMGLNSLSMAQFFQPPALFWNALANLTVSIFDAGKLASEKENAQAIHEEMVETYARTIYQAVREVESALAAIRLNGKRLEEQQEVITSSRQTLDSHIAAYAVGGIDHMVLLDAERAYHHYLDEYRRIKMDYYRAYISLFQALGGGVNFAEPLPGKGFRPTLAQGDTLGSASLAAPKMVSESNGHGNNAANDDETRHARFPLLNPLDETTSHSTRLPEASAKSLVIPLAGEEANVSLREFHVNGVEWVAQSPAEHFWQVELPGLYHRSTIAPAWRDLRARYPKLMETRAVRPRLKGKIEDSTDSQMAWYRLYVGKFETPEPAHELCATLQANFQRCRVVSSHSDETVAAPALLQIPSSSAPEPKSTAPAGKNIPVAPSGVNEKQSQDKGSVHE